MVATAGPYYCTTGDVINRLSAEGVQYRIDDDPPDILGDILDDASRRIEEYTWQLYSQAALATSDWVRHRTADLAACLLCERRGNPVPAGIEAKCERATALLERVQAGLLPIPFLPVLKTAAPGMSQPRVRLDPFPRTVIERSRGGGTKAAGYRQHNDSLDLGGWAYSI